MKKYLAAAIIAILANTVCAENIAVKATPETLLKESGCLNIIKGDDEEKTNCYEYEYQLLKTNVDWLNKILAADMYSCFDKKEKYKEDMDLKQAAQKHFEASIDATKETIKETETLSADSETYKQEYIGQRYNIVQFRTYESEYNAGAAHPMSGYDYQVFDLEKEKQLSLKDIIERSKEKHLKRLLKNKYAEYMITNDFFQEECAKDYNCMDEKAHKTAEEVFYVREKEELSSYSSFYFTADGITFSFPPYAIAAYSYGQIDLNIEYEKLRGVVREEYL